MGFKWPKGVKEVHYLDKLIGNKAIFKDGHEQEADAIILCSGYLHHFPFLTEDLKLKTRNRLYPPKLYKGVIWQDNEEIKVILLSHLDFVLVTYLKLFQLMGSDIS